jgi:hypothetical protein
MEQNRLHDCEFGSPELITGWNFESIIKLSVRITGVISLFPSISSLKFSIAVEYSREFGCTPAASRALLNRVSISRKTTALRFLFSAETIIVSNIGKGYGL